MDGDAGEQRSTPCFHREAETIEDIRERYGKKDNGNEQLEDVLDIELIALRLYTGPLWGKYSNALRHASTVWKASEALRQASKVGKASDGSLSTQPAQLDQTDAEHKKDAEPKGAFENVNCSNGYSRPIVAPSLHFAAPRCTSLHLAAPRCTLMHARSPTVPARRASC